MTDFEKKETVKSGIFYFVMTQLSTLFVIAGVIAMHVHSGDGTFSTVVLPASLKAVVFLLLFTGFSIKAGLIPFHKWLPYAHSAAPSNISALMSGVMIKVAIYAMIRFLLQIMAPDSWWGVLILIIATISTFLGVIYALKEHDIKRLLAYHSIENIGIIMMGVGLYIIFMHQGVEQLAMLALYGGVFHVLNHALFKSLLFLSAGSVVNATGTRNIEDMGGLIKYMPYTATMFLIGSIAISALPPLNGFVSELMIFESLLQAGFHNINVVISILLFASLSLLALTSALAAACFVKAFGTTFLAVPRTNIKPKEATKLTIFSQAILALAIIILGVFSYQIFAALGVDVPIPNLMYVGIILALLIAATAIVFWTRKVRVAETWGCGIISQNGKMEYTASGFSEPIVTIFKSIFRTKKERNIEYHDSKKAIVKTGHAEINLFKFFEELIYMPIAKAVKRVSVWFSDMQNSIEPDLYILQAFATIAILLAIIWWII